MYDDDKPELDDDLLMHYGVAGMKWGKHRAKADGLEIKAARTRLQAKQIEYRQAKKAIRKAPKGEDKDAAKANVAKLKTDFLKNPDRVTASRMTKGEKTVALLLTVPTGGLGGVAAIAARSAASRRIEQKQDDGKYDK